MTDLVVSVYFRIFLGKSILQQTILLTEFYYPRKIDLLLIRFGVKGAIQFVYKLIDSCNLITRNTILKFHLSGGSNQPIA